MHRYAGGGAYAMRNIFISKNLPIEAHGIPVHCIQLTDDNFYISQALANSIYDRYETEGTNGKE
jgi:hypothetical protein